MRKNLALLILLAVAAQGADLSFSRLLRITKIYRGNPAAGVREGDYLLGVNGSEVHGSLDLCAHMVEKAIELALESFKTYKKQLPEAPPYRPARLGWPFLIREG